MTAAPVLTLDVRERRRPNLFWAIGILALVAITIASYPAVRDNPGLGDFAADMPDFIKALIGEDFVSPAGYINSQIYLSMLPVLFLILGVGRAASTLAGEEQDGTLELTLTHPITRTRLLIEKFAEIVFALTLLSVVTWLSTWLGALSVDMDISSAAIGAATASTALLAIAIGAVTYALGAATGRRGLAMGGGAGIAAVSWIVYGIAPLVDVSVLDKLTLWEYAFGADPLANGMDWGGSLVLVVITILAFGVAVVSFQRRDIGTA